MRPLCGGARLVWGQQAAGEAEDQAAAAAPPGGPADHTGDRVEAEAVAVADHQGEEAVLAGRPDRGAPEDLEDLEGHHRRGQDSRWPRTHT